MGTGIGYAQRGVNTRRIPSNSKGSLKGVSTLRTWRGTGKTARSAKQSEEGKFTRVSQILNFFFKKKKLASRTGNKTANFKRTSSNEALVELTLCQGERAWKSRRKYRT